MISSGLTSPPSPEFLSKLSFNNLLLCCLLLASQLDFGRSIPALHHCPHQCSCNSVKIDCSDQSLVRIPDLTITRHHAAILNFSYNQIEEIRTANFMSPHLTNIQVLNLKHNSIFYMEDNPFVALPSLKHLDLSSNLLESMSPHAIDSNSKLETLNLSSNVFGMHPPKLMSTSLVSLDLSYCKIEKFTEENLAHLPNLKHLDLSVNMLTHVHSNIFSMVPIKTLNVAFNPWKCNCNTVRLHHHLLKLGLMHHNHNIQCLHSNKVYETVNNLDQPIHQHKFCIKELNQGSHKEANSSRAHTFYNYTRSKHTKEYEEEEKGSENVAMTIILYAVGLFLLVVIVTTATAVLVRRIYVGGRRANTSSTYSFVGRTSL